MHNNQHKRHFRWKHDIQSNTPQILLKRPAYMMTVDEVFDINHDFCVKSLLVTFNVASSKQSVEKYKNSSEKKQQ